MALDDDADDLPEGPPPPPSQRKWRHPSEVSGAAAVSKPASGRPSRWSVLAVSAVVGTLVAVVAVGLVREMGSSGSGRAVGNRVGSFNAGTSTGSSTPWVGLAGADLEDEGAVMVTEVEADGPAARAGIVAGDVVVRVDEVVIASMSDLQDEIGRRSVGDTVVIHVIRASVRMELPCTLGERPG
jgi:S1-C subfamily serine protease